MARILLVDDYPDALEVWALYLRMCGFEVVTAADGASALAIAAERPPDIAILDLEMPGLSGYEVARRLRAHPATRTMPLLAVTGHSHPSRIAEAREAGFDHVLTKPCDPDLLCLEIRQRLDIADAKAGVAVATLKRQNVSQRH